jgi:hypothetical protein
MNRFNYIEIKHLNNNNQNIKRNKSPQRNKTPPPRRNSDEDFKKKIEELRMFANLNNSPLRCNSPLRTNSPHINNLVINNEDLQNNNNNNDNINNNNQTINFQISPKILTYGIKKTILSDFNSLYSSSNCNDFKIGLNKNLNTNKTIFDCFYLFPNICEINSKNETNIINEKKIEYFENRFEPYDVQYFPIDFFSCGINIPMKTSTKIYSKLVIKNIYWNIFQTINNEKYKDNELLAIIPENNDYAYKNIKLFVHFELHSQIPKKTDIKILPYKNDKLKSASPANTCLYKSIPIEVSTLNGMNSNNIEIILSKEIGISCALLCIKVSVPDYCTENLKGNDKYNKLFCGYIPFSQFIINFEYDLI